MSKTKADAIGNARYCCFYGLEPGDVLIRAGNYLKERNIDLSGFPSVPMTLTQDEYDGDWTLTIETDYWFDGVEDDED